MKRSEKAALLTKILQGDLKPEAAKRLMNPAPQHVSGVLILSGDEPQPSDPVNACLTFSGGTTKDRAMTYEEFGQLPESTQKTLFILPDNHRQ